MEHYFTNNKNLKTDINKINAKIKDTTFIFYTDNGVFNKKGLDYGTRFLLENFSFENKKSFLDVGCGCGPIGLYIAMNSKKYSVDMIDVNDRAINLTKKSIEENKSTNINVFRSNVYENVKNKYDAIITNPPIHAGKEVVYSIIKNAKNHLNENGELWIVMRKDQGAKSMIKDMKDIYLFDVVAKSKGFYILKGICVDK